VLALSILPAIILPSCGSADTNNSPPGEAPAPTAETQRHSPPPEFLPEDELVEETIEDISENISLKAPVTEDSMITETLIKSPSSEAQDSPVEGMESFNTVIGVGGGAGGRFGGKYAKRRSVKGGGRATASALSPSHGGTDLVNDEDYDLQFFKSHGVNPFVDTDDDCLSTFAADVDTGAFTICRKFLDDGHLPKTEAVRVEEFVNWFDYDYVPPREGTFAAYISGGPSPFAPNRRLLSIGIKGQEIDVTERKDAVLTFVIDVSGSMNRQNRLELVKRALRLLINELRPSDRIGIAVYGSEGRVVLGHTPISEGRDVILEAIDRLQPGGSTNAEEGLRIGYAMAGEAFRPGLINRVILCSDGVANVGRAGPDSIYEVIEGQVKKGVCLTAVGFGMDNYNDVLMERLGDKGNGHYAYVDTIDEARRVFVDGITGTLQVIARDVKIQVEFDPTLVRSYRLVGYENRRVADKDFRNDNVDGGEVGAGHAVTAVYELKMWETAPREAPLGWVRIRYKDPDYQSEVTEFQTEIRQDSFVSTTAGGTPSFRLASCVVQFAEILRKSYWAKGTSISGAAEEAAALADIRKNDPKIAELKRLIERYSALATHNLADK